MLQITLQNVVSLFCYNFYVTFLQRCSEGSGLKTTAVNVTQTIFLLKIFSIMAVKKLILLILLFVGDFKSQISSFVVGLQCGHFT